MAPPRRPPLWYRLGMRAAAGAAPLAARFNPKLAKGLEGRRQLLDRLTAWGSAYRDQSRPLIWMHAPSVGEGLQAKPVIEMLRSTHPEWQIAYTFFSPSAERLARSLPVDVVDYLPWDRPDAVQGALEALKPTALVYSKLDVWPELTLGAAARGVKLGLISATVSPTSSRLNWPARNWSRTAYEALDKIGAISEADATRLELLGARPSAMSVTGDTRYDSVLERAGRLDPTIDALTRLEVPAGGAFTVVAGSTWPADEAVLLPTFADLRAQVPTARLVLAPHEPNPDHLAGIATAATRAGLPRPVRLSQLSPGGVVPLVVVDRVGLLADLYAAGDVAFVGGGFHRAGLHSVLEPAAFAMPVIFGPRWGMSRDAGLLLEAGGAAALPEDGRHALLARWSVWHHDAAQRRAAGLAARRVVEEGRGAAERTADLVRSLLA
ncbi:MAG TPA: glycosyltransferase N-terminal domain-containing protein [Gemmatimonadales bacterium]|nr:glycosyltransferase N-terminal domain-containing protein [Gemmatimonadales bacterium]